MQKIAFWTCAALAGAASTIGLLTALYVLLQIFQIPFPVPVRASFLFLIQPFGSLMPSFFGGWGLWPLETAALAFFFWRRMYLGFRRSQWMPLGYRGFPRLLVNIGAGFFFLGFIGLLLSFAASAGSGVPAGMLMIPATLCVPWGFLLSELFSLRRHVPPPDPRAFVDTAPGARPPV